MKSNLENPLSLENVRESLLKKGLISLDQKQAVLRKGALFYKNTHGKEHISGKAGTKDANPLPLLIRLQPLKLRGATIPKGFWMKISFVSVLQRNGKFPTKK